MHLSEKDLMHLRIGKALCDIDAKLFPKIKTQKHTKNSGEEIMRNVSEVIGIIKEALGPDSRHTLFSNALRATSEFCGINKSTVFRRTPEREIPRRKPLRDMGKLEKCRNYASQLDLLQRHNIIKHIHEQWRLHRDVTVEGVWKFAKAELDFRKGQTIFLHVLRGLGFVYRKKDQNSIVTERPDIIQKRAIYLKKKEEWDAKNAFYAAYDETWGHNGMTRRSGWQHSNAGMYKRAKLMDIESSQYGPEKGSERGKRVIVAAVLTEVGVLRGSELLLISGMRAEDQSADYHRDMDGANFERYYRVMIPLFAAKASELGRPPVFVCDNAPYHNLALKKPPTSTSPREEIINFLTENGLKFYPQQTKAVLYELARDFIESNGGREAFTVYKFDDFAKSHGVFVLRLPQYHCFFNPIELLWAQMKQNLRKHGATTDTVQNVRDRAKKFLSDFPADAAAKLFRHTQKLEEDIRDLVRERDSMEHDEFFNLRYDVDSDGRLFNVYIDSDEDYLDLEEEEEESQQILPSDNSFSTEDDDCFSDTDFANGKSENV